MAVVRLYRFTHSGDWGAAQGADPVIADRIDKACSPGPETSKARGERAYAGKGRSAQTYQPIGVLQGAGSAHAGR